MRDLTDKGRAAAKPSSRARPLSTPPQKLGADNHAAMANWHFAMTLATDFVDQLNG